MYWENSLGSPDSLLTSSEPLNLASDMTIYSGILSGIDILTVSVAFLSDKYSDILPGILLSKFEHTI